jgi:hypothetical protein
MTAVSAEPYPILEVQREWVLEPEALGSKVKFWYRRPEDQVGWLFKFPQPNTGQHWAEKIAEEIAASLGILHARVELALFENIRGSATESFARDGRNLFHGNQILAGQVLGYDPSKQFRQSDHTLANVFLALDRVFANPEGARRAKAQFAEYVILDALIGNTDRHHENWGILLKREGDQWAGTLAPTFDHASSLGRELADSSEGKCRERIIREGRVGAYSEKASGAIFWDRADKRGLSPLGLARRATDGYPEFFGPALGRLERLDRRAVEKITERAPADWMTPLARQFAVELMCYNMGELKRSRP